VRTFRPGWRKSWCGARNHSGYAARSRRDKVTIITSPDLSDLGAWLEQLLAESTGKVGKGIIPVDREELAAPEVYGNDRVFAYIHTDMRPRSRRMRR
jgi:transaldolase/glucose-6-phosphate isomerase